MLFLFMAIAGIGLLIKYTLLPGYMSNSVHGSNIEMTYLGMNRHQWGEVHLILSYILVFLLVLHIILHRKWIVSVFKRMFVNKFVKISLTSLIVAATLIFAVLPFMISPELSEKNNKHRNCSNSVSEKTITANQQQISHNFGNNINIKGFMTINEIANKYKVKAKDISVKLHIPAKYSDETLGRLRKQYPFKMSEVRRIVAELKR